MPSCDSNLVAGFLSGDLSQEQRRTFEDHLRTCGECRAVVDVLDHPADSLVSGVRAPEGAPMRIGQRVGRYLIVDWLGEGGMGAVYAAHDPELDRTVALKVLRPGASDTALDDGARLLREARAMARVVHPNVVTVFDTGLHDEGVFIAMERVDGTTLRDWLAEKPRNVREIVEVFVEAGKGVAAAHDAGLVHRDFKPENVLIGTDGRVRVTDFGLAREGKSPSDMNVGEMGSVGFGTPAYMSPEQLHFEHADARSDQFSFSVALHEALYGQRPYQGSTLPALWQNIVDGRVADAPKGSRVPSWLRKVLLRALRGSAAERYPTMHALLDALVLYSRRSDPRAIWRRRAGWTIAAACGLLAFHAMRAKPASPCHDAGQKFAGVWDEPRKRAIHEAFVATKLPYAEQTFQAVRGSLDAYAEEWTRGHTDACEATWVRGEQSPQRLDQRMACLDGRLNEVSALGNIFATADGATVEHAVTAAQSLTRPARCSDPRTSNESSVPEPGKAPRVDALKKTLAQVKELRDAGHYKEAMAPAAAAVAEARELGHVTSLAQALYLRANLLSLSGAPPKDAESALYEAAWTADRAGDDTTRAQAWAQLLFVVGTREQRASEVPLINGHALAAIARASNQEELEYARHQALASAYRDQGRFADARTEIETALGMARSLFGRESAQAAKSLLDLGWSLLMLAEHDKAREAMEAGLAITERVLGSAHPQMAAAHNALATLLSREKKYAESAEHYQRAISILVAIDGEVHPDVAAYLDNLGNVRNDQGDYRQAITLHGRALAIYEQIFGPAHSELVSPLLALGRTYNESNDAASARPVLERALSLCGEGTDPGFTADVKMLLAETMSRRERHQARTLATAARDFYRANPGQGEALEEAESWLKAHP